MKKILLLVVLAILITSVSAFAAQQFMISFINHTDQQIHFYVDGDWVCTANAGMICYSTTKIGPHSFDAKGGTFSKHAEATLYENADNPSWTICNVPEGADPNYCP